MTRQQRSAFIIEDLTKIDTTSLFIDNIDIDYDTLRTNQAIIDTIKSLKATGI